MLPICVCLIPPACNTNMAPWFASSSVCINLPAQAASRLGPNSIQLATSLPQGGQPMRRDTKTWGIFIHQGQQATEPLIVETGINSVTSVTVICSLPTATTVTMIIQGSNGSSSKASPEKVKWRASILFPVVEQARGLYAKVYVEQSTPYREKI